MRQVLAFSLPVIHGGFETLNNVFTVIQLASVQARIQTEECLSPESAPVTLRMQFHRIILGLN